MHRRLMQQQVTKSQLQKKIENKYVAKNSQLVMVWNPQTSSVNLRTVNNELPCRPTSRRSHRVGRRRWTRYLLARDGAALHLPDALHLLLHLLLLHQHVKVFLLQLVLLLHTFQVDAAWRGFEQKRFKIKQKRRLFSARTACSRAVWRDLAFRIFWNSSDWTRRCSSRLLFSDGSSSSLPDEPSEKDNRMTTKPCCECPKSNGC